MEKLHYNHDMANNALVLKTTHAVVPHEGLDVYLRDISHIPVLSREEEQAVALQWFQSRDRDAGQKLVISNLKFVVKIAKEYTRYGFKLSELIQEGNMGLLHAVDKYDPRKGYRLITYAVWWIRAYIQAFVLRSWSLVRTGTTRIQRKLFSSLQKARRTLAAMSSDGEPSNKQLAHALDIEEQAFDEALTRMQARDVSLDQPLSSDNERSMGDGLVDEDSDIEGSLIRKDLRAKVRDCLDDVYDDLKPRERYLLEHRLLSDMPVTLEALGEEFGVTRERVRQLENRLKDKLRVKMAPALGY